MNGFINLYKEAGATSNKTLGEVKRMLRCKKAGFLGTLDPCATGVLPIGLGFGTKLFPFFEKTSKTYKCEIIFGAETDTQDATGTETKKGNATLATKSLFEESANSFLGEIEQLPPMYSAKKVDGKRLYESARKGVEIKREPKKVKIESIEFVSFGSGRAEFTAKVSTGTYIRTLCEDIGRKVGSLAHMGNLVRLESHIFKSEDGITIAQLKEALNDPQSWLLPLDFPLSFMKELTLTPVQEKPFTNGNPVNSVIDSQERVRVYSALGKFLGIGRVDLVVKKVFPDKLVR